MSQGRYVISTISRLLTARLLYRVFYALSVILISNYLITDPALLDIFEVAIAAVNIVMIVSEVGMSMVVMRSGAQHNKETLQKYYGTALVIETIAWISLFTFIVGGYALLNGFTAMFWLLFILGIGHAIIQYRVVFRSIYRSLYKKEWITFIEVIDGILKVIGVYFITRLIHDVTLGVYFIAGWQTITTAIFVAIYGFNTLRYVKPRLDKQLYIPMLKEGAWFSMQALVMTVYFEIDKIMLRLFQSTGWADIADGDVGRYAAAARLVLFVLIFHRVGLQVITPYLYEHYKSNMDKYRRIVHLSTRYLGVIGMGMGVGLFVLSDEIIQLIYDPGLWEASSALRLFGIFVIIRFIGITSSQIFATAEKQPLRTKLEIAGVILNIILDIILIPLYGFMGGAIATVITELIIQIIFFIISRRLIQDNMVDEVIRLVPAFLAAVIMGITIWWLKANTHIMIAAMSGSIIFVFSLYIFRFFNKKDLALIGK